jgi:hypothetical protein
MEDLSRKIKIDNLKFCNLLTNESGKLPRRRGVKKPAAKSLLIS